MLYISIGIKPQSHIPGSGTRRSPRTSIDPAVLKMFKTTGSSWMIRVICPKHNTSIVTQYTPKYMYVKNIVLYLVHASSVS